MRGEALYIAPGSPWVNGYAGSFHGRWQDELHNAEVFTDVRDAKALASSWKNEYSLHRQHSSLGYVPPASFAATLAGPPVGAALLPPARPASIRLLEPRLSSGLVQNLGAGHHHFPSVVPWFTATDLRARWERICCGLELHEANQGPAATWAFVERLRETVLGGAKVR